MRKVFLRLASYFFIIFSLVFLFPVSESLKTENQLDKKTPDKKTEETSLVEEISEEEKEVLDNPPDEFLEEEFQSVKRVIDGDTIVLDNNEVVRLIGINTPEKYQEFFTEATLKTKELIFGKEIVLEYDKTRKDIYGRTLAYIYCEDIFINSELLRQGFAKLMTIPPNTKYAKEFKEALNYAKKEKRGIWAN